MTTIFDRLRTGVYRHYAKSTFRDLLPVNTLFNKNTAAQFSNGDLIIHRTTGAWAIYAGAISGDSVGIRYETHMAYTLSSRTLNARHRIATNAKAMREYTLLDGKKAHQVMRQIYKALGGEIALLRLKRVPDLKPCMQICQSLRDSHIPGAIARAQIDMLGLYRGVDNGHGLTYLSEFDRGAYMIAQLANRIYGVSVDEAFKHLHALTDPNPEPFVFPYENHKVLLGSHKAAVNIEASGTIAPSQLQPYVNIRQDVPKPIRRILSGLFTPSEIEDFGWFSVESDDTQRYKKHRIKGREDLYVPERVMTLLRILHQHSGFISFADILADDVEKSFKGSEKAVLAAYATLRRLVNEIPGVKPEDFLMMYKSEGLCMIKKGQEKKIPSIKRKSFINQPQDEDFVVHQTTDYGAFKVEQDFSRRVLSHRFANQPVYLRPNTIKLLERLHEAGGRLSYDQLTQGKSPLFNVLADAHQAFRELHQGLEKAGYDASSIIQREQGKCYVLHSTPLKPKA